MKIMCDFLFAIICYHFNILNITYCERNACTRKHDIYIVQYDLIMFYSFLTYHGLYKAFLLR